MPIDQSDPDKEASFESRGEPPLNSAIDRLPVAIREGQAGTTCRAHAHRAQRGSANSVHRQIGGRWRFGRDLYRHGQARPGEFGAIKWISTLNLNTGVWKRVLAQALTPTGSIVSIKREGSGRGDQGA